MLQATDSTFGAKLRENLQSNGRFKFDPKKPTDDFIVQHYAGPVTYSCTKFLDKNKDTLSPGKHSTHCSTPVDMAKVIASVRRSECGCMW